ncbi:EF-hand domain-containing protein [Phaeobacter marinintestinus]|uniref:EF-hand domain-containing protein n=1 Tax=Falsiphaeobacter marinintestinus TaxID=1492905 RepID=UPI0011B3F4E3|nr:hypothetical protein [Phaeobacter marinintestinus]
MKHTLLCAAALTCTATLALSDTMPGSALIHLDVDANSQVTQDEFVQQMGVFFAPMDTNGNGQLDPAEVETFLDPETFDATDTNGNGMISSSEYSAQMVRDFQSADTDGNGVLD